MYLQSLTTAVPPHAFTQRECWEIIQRSPAANRLNARSLALLRKVLLNDNGIERRHFAAADPSLLFDLDADGLSRNFQQEAPVLGETALLDALKEAGVAPTGLDALFVCTCTGYLCPGLSSYLSERIGMRSDAFLHDAVGLGCGAAIPTMRAVSHFLAAHPGAAAACLAVEICSAAFYLDDDPGVLISACLFADGAAAAVWTGDRRPSAWKAGHFDTLHDPAHRECLRFETKQGKLRNKLHKTVPETAAQAVETLHRRLPEEPARVLAHPGGRDVITALRERLPNQPLTESTKILRRHGNMSSPSVLFALREYFERENGTAAKTNLWLTSFGAGFSAHGCLLQRS